MTVLSQLTGAGVRLRLDGAELIVKPRSPLTDVQLAYLREHKAELVEELKRQRRRRRDDVLLQLAEHPGVKYAFAVENGDPTIITVGVRDVATFEMTTDRFDGFRFLAFLAEAS